MGANLQFFTYILLSMGANSNEDNLQENISANSKVDTIMGANE